MSYQILNPERLSLIGFHSCNMFNRIGVAIRECSEFDQETFDCEFRICRPYETPYVNTEDGIQQNPMYWSRPARRYGKVVGENINYTGIEYWECDKNEENGRWVKLRGKFEIQGSDYWYGNNYNHITDLTTANN